MLQFELEYLIPLEFELIKIPQEAKKIAQKAQFFVANVTKEEIFCTARAQALVARDQSATYSSQARKPWRVRFCRENFQRSSVFLQARVYRINLHRVNVGRNSSLEHYARETRGEWRNTSLCPRYHILSCWPLIYIQQKQSTSGRRPWWELMRELQNVCKSGRCVVNSMLLARKTALRARIPLRKNDEYINNYSTKNTIVKARRSPFVFLFSLHLKHVEYFI